MRHLWILLGLALPIGARLPFRGPRVATIADEAPLSGGVGASSGSLEPSRRGRLEPSPLGGKRAGLGGYAARLECRIVVRP